MLVSHLDALDRILLHFSPTTFVVNTHLTHWMDLFHTLCMAVAHENWFALAWRTVLQRLLDFCFILLLVFVDIRVAIKDDSSEYRTGHFSYYQFFEALSITVKIPFPFRLFCSVLSGVSLMLINLKLAKYFRKFLSKYAVFF